MLFCNQMERQMEIDAILLSQLGDEEIAAPVRYPIRNIMLSSTPPPFVAVNPSSCWALAGAKLRRDKTARRSVRRSEQSLNMKYPFDRWFHWVRGTTEVYARFCPVPRPNTQLLRLSCFPIMIGGWRGPPNLLPRESPLQRLPARISTHEQPCNSSSPSDALSNTSTITFGLGCRSLASR